MTSHIGRSFEGHSLEDGCPCEKAPCGLVIYPEGIDNACAEHPVYRAKTLRQAHSKERCPASSKPKGDNL